LNRFFGLSGGFIKHGSEAQAEFLSLFEDLDIDDNRRLDKSELLKYIYSKEAQQASDAARSSVGDGIEYKHTPPTSPTRSRSTLSVLKASQKGEDRGEGSLDERGGEGDRRGGGDPIQEVQFIFYFVCNRYPMTILSLYYEKHKTR